MNKVKYIITALLGVLFAACSEEENVSQAGKSGFQVSLAESVRVESRRTPEEIGKPAVSNFKLKITRQPDGLEAYNGSYTANPIPAPVGTYTLEAEQGDNPVLALDAPYYKGTAEASVTSETESTQVTINCKVANALASVKFDDSGVYKFDNQFSSYKVRVAVSDISTELTKNDGKSAYYQAGSKPVFTFEGTLENGADIEPVALTNEKLSADSTFEAGKHCVITLKLGATSSGMRVEISKVEVQKVTINETIPMEWLPKPKVEAEGFDANNTLTFVETEQKQAALNLNLSSALQDIKLKFNFEDKQFATLDKEKTYLLSVPEEKAAIEEALGITLPNVGDKPESIDLSNLLAKLQTNAGTSTTNTIEIDVQANNRWSSEAKEGEEAPNLKYILTCNKPEFSIAVQPGNVWTKTFTIDEPTITIGNADILKEKLVYQYKTAEESEWHECSNGLEQVFSEHPSNKAYQVRAFYREGIASNVVDVTLEEPAQLPNSKMDEWSNETYVKDGGWFNDDETFYSFNPWINGGNPFWDTNNDFTTRHRHNDNANIYHYNGFHAVSSVQGRNGLAAELRSTANGRGNMIGTIRDFNKVAGKLFTGTANVTMGTSGFFGDANGSKDTYTEEKNASFNSRPTALTFYYKYAPYNSDAWSVHIELLDENKNVIIQNEKTSSETKGDWAQETVSLNYADGTTYAKCKYIYVIFKSTINEGANMPYREITQTFYVLENGSLSAHTYEPAYVGSILTIDDISLVYDK